MEKRRSTLWRRERNRLRLILGFLAVCALAQATGCARNSSVDTASSQGKGDIFVTSAPEGAVVAFNGNLRGTTYAGKPVVIKAVNYGRHSIRTEFPGYVAQILEVDVRAEKVPVHMKLTKGGAGRLVVLSNPPGAEVFIASRYYGKTNPTLEVSSLRPGAYSMWLRLPGYRMERRNIVVERGRERIYRVFLEREP